MQVDDRVIPDPPSLPDVCCEDGVELDDQGLQSLVKDQSKLRKQIKQDKAEKVVSGKGRGKGKAAKGGNKKTEAEDSEAAPVARKRKQKTSTEDSTAEPSSSKRKKENDDEKEEKDGAKVKPVKVPANAKFLKTPFKTPNVKVRNPRASPGKRKEKRQEKAKSGLLKLKRGKQVFKALEDLPLLQDETKMSFGGMGIF